MNEAFTDLLTFTGFTVAALIVAGVIGYLIWRRM